MPQRSETKKDDGTAGSNVGDFSSQAGGRAVLGNSVGKKREEGYCRAPELPALQVYSVKGSAEKQHHVGKQSEVGGKIFKMGEGWSLSLYGDRSKRSK